MLPNSDSVLSRNCVSINSVNSALHHSINNVSASMISSNKSVNHGIWHYRLGHPADLPMKMLSPMIPHLMHKSNTICSICPLAKQHRLPFPHSTSTTKQPFDLIHCDIWGPFSTKSITGSSYFLTIVDDHSRFTWIHLLDKNLKSEITFNHSSH